MKRWKIGRKLFILLVFLFTIPVYAVSISVGSYRINDGKLEVVEYNRSSSDKVEARRGKGVAEEIISSGEISITDKGGRRLTVKLDKGKLDGRYDEYYANGRPFTVGKYNNGKKEGEWKIYTDEGNLWKRYTYKDGVLNGKYVNYYSKAGVEETVGNYRNGKKHGTWNSYYSSGKRKMNGEYSGGNKEGTFTEWYENGQRKSVINYTNDRMSGKMSVYYETGALFYEADMDDRDGSVRGYYTDGSLSFEGRIRNGRRTGTWNFYDRSGKLYNKVNY